LARRLDGRYLRSISALQITEIGIDLGDKVGAVLELHPMAAFRKDVEVRVRAPGGDPQAAFKGDPPILAAVQHEGGDGDLLQFGFGNAADLPHLAGLAGLREKLAMRLMTPVRYTPKTIANRTSLRGAIKKIREQGYAVGDEELDPDVRAVAAPVFWRGQCRFCLSVAVPSFRLPDERLPEMIPEVKAAALTITERLADT
jgi:hypothetical protein